MRVLSCLLVVLLATGCAKSPPKEAAASLKRFEEVYQELSPPPQQLRQQLSNLQSAQPEPTVSLSVKEMPLGDFLRLLSSKYDVAVIWSEGMDKRLVSVEASDVPIAEVFGGLSRRFAVSCSRVGSSWYVGEFRNEDKGWLVRKTARLKAESLRLAVGLCISEDGRAEVFNDGLVVCVDRAENLRRVVSVLEEIEGARSDTWVLQLYLFSTSRTAAKELGVDTSALIDLSYTFAKSSLLPAPTDGVHLASRFSAVMKATASRDDVRLIGKPLFLLADGEKASLNSGVKVPVPRFTTSDQGAVTKSGFDYIQSGLSSQVELREGAGNTVRLDLRVSLGQITGFTEGAPIQASDEFATVAVLASSGVYLLGALDRDETRAGASGIFEAAMLKKTSEVRSSQVQIWARLYRIGALNQGLSDRAPGQPAVSSPARDLLPMAVVETSERSEKQPAVDRAEVIR